VNPVIIPKAQFCDFVARLQSEHEVVAPVRKGDLVEFESIESADDINFDYVVSKRPPKRFVLPEREVLMCYRCKGKTTEMEEPQIDAPKRVLLGLRPCDARAFSVLDMVFAEADPPDPYYVAKRENLLLIGLACNEPASTCFCSTMQGTPFGAESLDALLVDLGDRYLAEPQTESIAPLLDGYPEATGDDLRRKEQLEQAARSAIETDIDLDAVKQSLDGNFDHPFWEEAGAACLNCAACAFLCPTCHCFDIQEERTKDGGQRVRCWDCCQFSQFTLHASGHNPRTKGGQRVRQRLMHKFRYIPDNSNKLACVGCGRCIVNCPVKGDLRKTLQRVATLGNDE